MDEKARDLMADLLASLGADDQKAEPNPLPGIVHEFGCTHDPCRCGHARTLADRLEEMWSKFPGTVTPIEQVEIVTLLRAEETWRANVKHWHAECRRYMAERADLITERADLVKALGEAADIIVDLRAGGAS